MSIKQTFMRRKFDGLLVSGTVTMIVVTALLLSDTFIAGLFLGKEAIEGINLVIPMYSLAANVIPAAFDIDNPDTARLASVMLRILAPGAVFICLSRVVAIFYQYTYRLARTIILFGMFIAVLPVGLCMIFGLIAPEGIAVSMAAGPLFALVIMHGYARLIKKEKLFDYSLMNF